MPKKVTMRDIAKKAGVSPASVSMILNKKSISRFSDDTISLVYKTCEELGYKIKHKNNVENSNLIYIICPSVINPYFATIIQSIENSAYYNGYETAILTTYWDEHREHYIIDKLSSSDAYGVIFSMIPQNPELAFKLNDKIPVVAIGDHKNELVIDTVDINNFNAGKLVAKHLIELGHKNVAYVSTTLNDHHSARVRRLKGIKKEYEDNCPEGNVHIFTHDISPETEIKNITLEHDVGYNLTLECIKKTPEITAIVAINDMVAYGVIDAIHSLGLKVPEDISVCGFDNIYSSKFSPIQLTTVDHSLEKCGESAFHLLINKLKDDPSKTHSSAITRIEYVSKLVVRNTTKKLIF